MRHTFVTSHILTTVAPQATGTNPNLYVTRNNRSPSNGVSHNNGVFLGVCVDTVAMVRSRGFSFRISPKCALIHSPGGAHMVFRGTHWVTSDHVHDGLPFPVSYACTVCVLLSGQLTLTPNPVTTGTMDFRFQFSCECTACTHPSR